MTLNVTPKTITIQNENANDGSQVDQMFSDCYGNESTIASYINDNCVLKTGANTFSGAQTFSAVANFPAGIKLGTLVNTENPDLGDLYYDVDTNTFTGIAKLGGNIATATNASPIVVNTTNPHGLSGLGNHVFITGALGNTAANGYWPVTIINANSFSLTGSTGNGAYTSGGVVYGYEQFVTESQIGALPTRYHGSATPVYSSASTITVAFIYERDLLDFINIAKSSSTVVNTATTGLNGIAQSQLFGTVSVTSGNTNVGFSDAQTSLQVGDVIVTAGGQARRIVSGSGITWTVNANWTSSEPGVNVFRGGLAASTYYYLYSTTNGVTPGLILSTRNVAAGDTLVDLPSGYSWSSQLVFVLQTDSSGNIVPFRVGSGWPKRPFISFSSMETAAGIYKIISAFWQSTFTTINCASIIPPVSRLVNLEFQPSRTGGSETQFYIRETGSGLTTGRYVSEQAGSGFYVQSSVANIPLNASQQLDIKAVGGGTFIDGYVTGYTITEIP